MCGLSACGSNYLCRQTMLLQQLLGPDLRVPCTLVCAQTRTPAAAHHAVGATAAVAVTATAAAVQLSPYQKRQAELERRRELLREA